MSQNVLTLLSLFSSMDLSVDEARAHARSYMEEIGESHARLGEFFVALWRAMDEFPQSRMAIAALGLEVYGVKGGLTRHQAESLRLLVDSPVPLDLATLSQAHSYLGLAGLQRGRRDDQGRAALIACLTKAGITTGLVLIFGEVEHQDATLAEWGAAQDVDRARALAGDAPTLSGWSPSSGTWWILVSHRGPDRCVTVLDGRVLADESIRNTTSKILAAF